MGQDTSKNNIPCIPHEKTYLVEGNLKIHIHLYHNFEIKFICEDNKTSFSLFYKEEKLFESNNENEGGTYFFDRIDKLPPEDVFEYSKNFLNDFQEFSNDWSSINPLKVIPDAGNPFLLRVVEAYTTIFTKLRSKIFPLKMLYFSDDLFSVFGIYHRFQTDFFILLLNGIISQNTNGTFAWKKGLTSLVLYFDSINTTGNEWKTLERLFGLKKDLKNIFASANKNTNHKSFDFVRKILERDRPVQEKQTENA